MATPFVTGVAALLKAYDPSLDWKAIKNRILAGGNNVASMASTITQKRLNAPGALTHPDSTALAPLRPAQSRTIANHGAAK
jgi:subtilisin family serine protease